MLTSCQAFLSIPISSSISTSTISTSINSDHAGTLHHLLDHQARQLALLLHLPHLQPVLYHIDSLQPLFSESSTSSRSCHIISTHTHMLHIARFTQSAVLQSTLHLLLEQLTAYACWLVVSHSLIRSMKCCSVLPSTVNVNVNVQIMNVSVIFNLPNYVCKVQVHFVVLHVGRSNMIIMWQPVDLSIGPQQTPRQAPAPCVISEEEEKTNKKPAPCVI